MSREIDLKLGMRKRTQNNPSGGMKDFSFFPLNVCKQWQGEDINPKGRGHKCMPEEGDFGQ